MSDTMREIFVKNLRYLMEARGINQADICRELGVSSATVSDWCTGKKYPLMPIRISGQRSPHPYAGFTGCSVT